MRSSTGVLFALVVVVGCATPMAVPTKKTIDAGPIECCRTNPDAGPEGCICEYADTNIVTVSGTTCSVSTTLDGGQVVDFTGIVVSTCP
jgi:hypothetical protein